MDALPIAVFWGLAIRGFFSRKPILLYLFFGSMSFGAFAVIPPGVTAGLTFTPTPIVALLIIIRVLGNSAGVNFLVNMALDPRKLGLLFAFWVTTVVVTLFMPRLFEGVIEIMPMRADLLTNSQPLGPTTQNISQLAYLTISVFAVFAFARLLRDNLLRQEALKAICVGGVVAVTTGILDLSSQYLPLDPLLTPFRTATYALLTDVEVLGAKRIVGLMPEASSFGGVCLGFLTSVYFFRRAMVASFLRDRLAPALIVLLALFVWLSTSSAAYVGLALFGALAVMEWMWRSLFISGQALRRRGLAIEFWFAFSVLFSVAIVLLMKPSLFDPIAALIDRMVFQKTSSHSFEERNYWTEVSIRAMYDSYLMGVGMGATRASNAIVAVFSNTGLIGGLLYYSFVFQTLMRKAPQSDAYGNAMISAVRWAFPVGFTIGLLVGTTADFRASGAFQFGLITAVAFAFPGHEKNSRVNVYRVQKS